MYRPGRGILDILFLNLILWLSFSLSISLCLSLSLRDKEGEEYHNNGEFAQMYREELYWPHSVSQSCFSFSVCYYLCLIVP